MSKRKTDGEGGEPPTKRTDVGHCRPPKEHQFKKFHCPNPSGRRGKKGAPMKTPAIPSSTHAKLLEFANTIMGEIDGEAVTSLDGILRTMRSMMREKPEYGKLLLLSIMQASKEEEEWKGLVLREAIAHKEEWGPRFANARLLGEPEPKIYPHPDDINIRPDGRVSFEGPVTAEDAREISALIELRGRTFELIYEINEDKKLDEDLRKEMWLTIRRRYYRYSRFIPKRLKKRFPEFEPVV